MKDYLKRPHDVMKAVRSLHSSGLSVSLPHITASGVMIFEIDECILTVAQILELFDHRELDRVGIRQFAAKKAKHAS